MSTVPVIEIGSDFEWMPSPQGPVIPWPGPCVWYASGQDAMLSLWKMLCQHKPGRVLHVPDFFGPDVPTAWRRFGIPMQFYADDPRWQHPQWETLEPNEGDLIMALNYFGVRDGSAWQNWHESNPQIVLVEDHTQDPVCEWALNSHADYALSSLRKTMPVPDGAMLWSPKDLQLPLSPSKRDWSGSGMRLAAMIRKRDYLANGASDEASKTVFRDYYMQGEDIIVEDEDLILSPWSYEYLKQGYPVVWRKQREENVGTLFKLLANRRDVQPLYTEWPKGHCPFSAELLFSTHALREHVQAKLIQERIYAPVHWRPGLQPSARTIDLSERVLTIPLDQRYSAPHVQRAASVILDALVAAG